MINRDIFEIANNIKQKIEIIEDDENNEIVLNEISELFNELFEHIKLFLINKKERYYGYFLMNMKVDVDYYRDVIAAVNIDTNPFTLIINPLLFAKYEVKEMIYIICHEIEHLVLNHPAEGVKLNPSKDPKIHSFLNLSMDAAVNDRLNQEVEKFKLNMFDIPHDLVDSNAFGRIFRIHVNSLQNYLYYYNSIPSEYKDDDDWIKELKGYIIVRLNGEKRIITSKNSKGAKIHIWTKLDTSDDVSNRIKNFVKNVLDGIPDDNRGLFPDYQNEALNKLLEPPAIKWENVLKRYIGSIPIPYKKTKMRLNRRQPDRFDIPGRMNDRTVKVIVAIDTSGSLTNRMLEKIFVEIFEILKKQKFELTIIEADCEVQKVYQARTKNDIQLEVKGRGGTSFTPTIEYINKYGKFRDAVLVYFTDGEGEWDIPRPKTYRNLWVIFGDKRDLSLKNPYGEIISLGDEYKEV